MGLAPFSNPHRTLVIGPWGSRPSHMAVGLIYSSQVGLGMWARTCTEVPCINTSTVFHSCSHLVAGLMSHLSCVKSEMDRHAIMEPLSEKGGKFIRHGKCNGRCLQFWFICIGKDFVGIFSIQVVLCNMDTSSESTAYSAPAQFIETDIREIKKKIKKMNWYMSRIDSKGGRRLETVEMDMAHLRKEFAWSISRTKNALTGMLTDLEIQFEKLELKVVKL